MACYVPFNNRNLDIIFFILRPTVSNVDDLVDALKQFSLYTDSLGCVHNSIFTSIHGNMNIWYGAWIKRSDDNKHLLGAALMSVLMTNVSSMAILVDQSFFEAYAGESKDGSPAAKFFTGDVVSLSSTTVSPSYENGLSYLCMAMFKDRFRKMEGAKAGVCFKSRSTTTAPRSLVGLFVWESLHLCYTYILTSDYRERVLDYLDGLALNVKYDVFRVVYVSGDSVLSLQFSPRMRSEVDKDEEAYIER